MNHSADFLLAIPVYNEEHYVERVLEEARRYCRDILVIDDGSFDRTPELLASQADVRIITHPENRGYGKSLSDAFGFARRHGFKWMITMDCDEQHDASQIPRFMDIAAEDGCDIISGTRYPRWRDVGPDVPTDRRTINRRVTATLNRELGLKLTDAFCGFKAYRVSALGHFDITVPGYAMPIQLWVQAARAGLRIVELPVPLIYNDPTRHFGGLLDDPAVRLNHYMEVLRTELAANGLSAQGRDRMPCRK